MLKQYNKKLRSNSRALRKKMTDAELALWKHLRRKQVLGLQFYRQKPLLNFIVDFYCPRAKLVIELDGGQHYEPNAQSSDELRDKTLGKLKLKVLRFDNSQVLEEIDSVLEFIHREVEQGLQS